MAPAVRSPGSAPEKPVATFVDEFAVARVGFVFAGFETALGGGFGLGAVFMAGALRAGILITSLENISAPQI